MYKITGMILHSKLSQKISSEIGFLGILLLVNFCIWSYGWLNTLFSKRR